LEEKQLVERQAPHWEIAVSDRAVSDEIEYLFKHALAQEAVYESLLLKTRKELHRKVAESIESVFAGRLNKFYATLAHHYTRAEQLAPAESYLFRAGEEAEQSAASAEALNLFREAAAIYDRLHGDGGDHRHRAALQKHIGMALLNTGRHHESIPCFDRALELLGEPVARTPVKQALRWVIDMSAVLLHVYAGNRTARRSRALEHDREVCKLFFERGHAEVTSDPRRLFLELATGLRRLSRIDPSEIDEACGMFVSCAGIFAYSGLSFAISRRMLGVAESLIRPGSVRDHFVYRAMAFTYDYLRGDWATAPTIEETFVDEALRHGMVWDVTLYIGLEMDRRLRRGDFTGARAMLTKLAEIRDNYGYAYAGSNHNGMLAILLIEERRLQDALPLTLHHHEVSVEGTLKLMTLGMLGKIYTLLDRRAEAADVLQRAAEVSRQEGVVSPWHQSIHHVAQLLYDVTALEAAQRGQMQEPWHRLRRRALRSSRRALATAAKVGKERVESLRLTGQLWWSLGKPNRARIWWRRCLAEAERMGARPEMARAYAAIGSCVGNAELDGVSGHAYIDRARAMFQDLQLDWDLEQLCPGRLTAAGQSQAA
jgi:tetratricopeptide (TPR) repeat protein